MRRLIGAALALLIAGGAGMAVGEPSTHQPSDVTTHEPASGGGWRQSEDPGSPFTPVGVIDGRNADAGARLPVAPIASATAGQATVPVRAPSPAKRATNWLPGTATLILLLAGMAMIVFALRGLLAARRRLTRLEERESESES